ncbi:pimeloyl-ACP methyl ester carboxylesterase [Kibdelosporangium banguiense]|uniref:Pimeloyl-ACP methyl ester carboxylesterase n=1 Tax=Kibdelosporangium banguiense TaxID=1365924 RepID=A0ABS4U2K8_9PSEU|nr:alpha/beta fold hydrolase [Kibdelosporangium banguiense]MBP2330897.1 pimeloyl-ACP methyl ester carboxylesterase [Kibdelosporangium banguiense]
MFEGPLRSLGIRLVTPAPQPGHRLAEAHLEAVTEAARQPVVVGGISLGAHLAVEWALANPQRCAGLLLALPAWNGAPGDAPAAVSARFSAQAIRANGLDATLSAVDGEPWLTAELERAWRRAGDGLADSLDVAATRPAPLLAELAHIAVPTGIAACSDDPVHPLAVAEQWASTISGAQLCTTTLRALGDDRESLGRATVLAWLKAGGLTRSEQSR